MRRTSPNFARSRIPPMPTPMLPGRSCAVSSRPSAVILHGDLKPILFLNQGYACRACARMAEHIGQRLLDNAENRSLDLRWEAWKFPWLNV